MTPRTGLTFGLAALVLNTALQAQSFRTFMGARQAGDEQSLHVRVQFAAGRFRVTQAADGTLYRARILYDEDHFEPVLAYTPDAQLLTVGVRGTESRGINLNYKNYPGQDLELALSPGVPVSLSLEFGAAEAIVDLGGLALTRADVRTGASATLLTFSRPTTGRCDELRFTVGAVDFRALNLGNARCRNLSFMGGAGDLALDFTGDWGDLRAVDAEIGVGIGSLSLTLPRAVGIEIQLSRFLSSFDQSGFIKRGKTYYSPNYDAATTRIRLDIKAALGSVEVRWQE